MARPGELRCTSLEDLPSGSFYFRIMVPARSDYDRTATKHSRVGGRFKNSVVIFLVIIHDE
jgi:hypothetical protein